MSIYGFQGGQPRTKSGNFADTSATTILDVDTEIPSRACRVVGITICNYSGGNATPLVEKTDGTTAVRLRDDATLADQGVAEVTLPGGYYDLVEGDSIRITAETNVSWHISYVEPDPFGSDF